MSHSPYYQDRLTEYDLCQDFPGDEIFIDGLHAMQVHFWNNNVNIDIPVVRVMNTAHYIAAYMFATSCSGDQMEYDIMAYDSLSCDKRLFQVAIIVLAAMLKRTEGFRANNCRNLLLENRTPDFEEGVTLYDRFLRRAEERFEEEAFLIDTNTQIQRLQAENEQLTTENAQLKYTITVMEKEKPQTIVYNYGTYNDIHDNPNSTIYATGKPQDEGPSTISGQPEPTGKEYCMYICREKLREQGLYTLDEFEQMIANAAKEPAMQFAKFLVRYRQQGILDFMGHTKRQIFDNMRAHFPEMRDYDYPNFAAAY